MYIKGLPILYIIISTKDFIFCAGRAGQGMTTTAAGQHYFQIKCGHLTGFTRPEVQLK